MKKEKNITPLILIGIAAFALTQKGSQPKKETKAPAHGSKIKVKKIDAEQFFKNLKPYAIALGKQIGVPYLFIMAQIALETRFGDSELYRKHFNVGGIKAVKGQKFALYDTWEYYKNKTTGKMDKTRIKAKFASYNNLPEGLVAYSKILKNRYFKKYLNKTTDAKKYVTLLQSGSPKYATDINYIPKIHKLIDYAKLAA